MYTAKKIKYGLAVSLALLVILLLVAFINMGKTISGSNKETVALGIIKDIEAIQLNTEHLAYLKNLYLKNENEKYLNEYTTTEKKIRESKNELLNYSIANDFKRKEVLELANVAARNIANNNRILDIKKYDDSSYAQVLFYDSIGNRQIDSVINLSGSLGKDALTFFNDTTLTRQQLHKQQVMLYFLLALLFIISGYFAYHYFRGNLKEAENLNKLLLYNSTLLKNIYDAIITTDNHFVITDWNVHAEKLYGYSGDEAKGKSLLGVLKIEEAEIENNTDPTFIAGTWKGEAVHHSKNGNAINVDVSKTAIINDAGKKTGCIYVVRDITARITLQKDLKHLSENLQEEVNLKASELNYVFERIADAFIALDNDWNYTYLNKAALAHHGVTEAEIIGKNIWEIYPHVVSEPIYEVLQLAKSTQTPQRCELYYSFEDKWYADLIYPSENGISIYYHDITGKKKAEIELNNAQQELINAESKFRALVEKSMVGVYIRKDKRFIYVNPRFAEIFGYSEEELYADFNIISLIAESERTKMEDNLRAYADHEISNHNYEFIGLHKNGTLINLEAFGSATNYNGEEVIIGTIIDITERKTATQKLMLADEALKNSNERYKLVAKATNDALWDWDIENDLLTGNERFNNMLGNNENTVTNETNFTARIHEDDREKLVQNLKLAFKQKKSIITEEFRFKDNDGNYKTIYDRAYILYKNEMAYRMLGAMQDITPMKESENKSLLEKALSDSIINSLPGIFYLFNKQGGYLRWNKNFETVTGYDAKEIINKHPLDFFTENEGSLVKEKIKNVFVTGSDIVEANLKTKTGQLIPYYFTGMLIRYQNEDCILGVGLDISEKIKSQNELLESEQKFRTLVQQASDGIIITDVDGNLIEVNESAATLTGYQKDELYSMNTDDIFVEEGGIKRPLRYNAMANGAVVISEHFIKRKGGKLLNVEVSAKQLSDGRFQRILRDITERTLVEDALRASEKKYRLLFNDNPLPMWINNMADNNFIDVNNAALIAYGYSKDEFLRMKLSDLDSFKNSLQKHLPNEKSGVGSMDGVYEHVKKNGQLIKVDILTHDIIYEGKSAILSLANDITVKFEAEESLQKSNEALRDLASHLETIRENERIHMAREIHDELGQQLTGLKMDISWLSRKIQTDDEAIKGKMKDAISLIDKTVITVRRIATELRPSILDDLGLIAAMEWQSEEFEKRSEIKSIFTSNVSQIQVNPTVATAVFRIFQESLTNVLRHSQATEVISFFRLEDDIITLFIEDNGVGFRDIEIKNKKTLGLLGMKERIQLINGNYEINGNAGKGTSVIITVPLK